MPNLHKFTGESVWGDYYDADEVDPLLDGRVERERDELKARAESLESKCAKMRELLGECAPRIVTTENAAGHRDLVARIDAILESEE